MSHGGQFAWHRIMHVPVLALCNLRQCPWFSREEQNACVPAQPWAKSENEGQMSQTREEWSCQRPRE